MIARTARRRRVTMIDTRADLLTIVMTIGIGIAHPSGRRELERTMIDTIDTISMIAEEDPAAMREKRETTERRSTIVAMTATTIAETMKEKIGTDTMMIGDIGMKGRIDIVIGNSANRIGGTIMISMKKKEETTKDRRIKANSKI